MINYLQNILIAPNVISKEGIDYILNHCNTAKKEDLAVFDPEKTNKSDTTQWKVDKEIRQTKMVEMNEEVFNNIFELYKDLVKNVINPYYNFEILDSEIPQILCYEPGGHYKPHVDAESLWKEPDGSVVWRKSTDRDLSTVLYLNDDFEGGDFVFPDFRIRVKPEPGLLIAFPSTHHYLHSVEPVTKGTRYSIVSWMRVKGFTTLEEIDSMYKDKYKNQPIK
jgi:predicted 2-oxoglutarate/Fe(II)-dependent dioxygenase YbiX